MINVQLIAASAITSTSAPAMIILVFIRCGQPVIVASRFTDPAYYSHMSTY